MLKDWKLLMILATISLLLFFVFLFAITDQGLVDNLSIKTIDMAYRALENFIFVSIAGVFLYQQIEDHTS